MAIKAKDPLTLEVMGKFGLDPAAVRTIISFGIFHAHGHTPKGRKALRVAMDEDYRRMCELYGIDPGPVHGNPARPRRRREPGQSS